MRSERKSNRFFLFICHTDVLILAIIYVFDKEAILTWRNFHPREEVSNARFFNLFIGFAIPAYAEVSLIATTIVVLICSSMAPTAFNFIGVVNVIGVWYFMSEPSMGQDPKQENYVIGYLFLLFLARPPLLLYLYQFDYSEDVLNSVFFCD